MVGLLRRNTARLVAVGTCALLVSAVVAQQAPAAVSSDFAFSAQDLQPIRHGIWQSVREVPPAFDHVAGWVSAIGAAVSLSDADGDGQDNDSCLVDPRTDTVTLAPVPGTAQRFAPLELRPGGAVPYEPVEMAPTGCLPGDFDEDGRIDYLVSYWGRSPVLFLRAAAELGPEAFVAQDLVSPAEGWATETATSADLDGDGHLDLVIGNYFPDDVDLLGRTGSGPEEAAHAMPTSMSAASNGGVNRVFRFTGATPATESTPPSVAFEEQSDAFTEQEASGWTLALGAQDLTGDALPELYVANDFGRDYLLHNVSTVGRIDFDSVEGARTVDDPKSTILGHDSFKGMGVDFGDLNGDSWTDLFVSSLGSPYGLVETHLAWVNDGEPERMAQGAAPFTDRATQLGLANSGWAWDAKFGDFNNDGPQELLQSTGFVRGDKRSGWPQLQELGTAQDGRFEDVANWPDFSAGVDISGNEPDAFFTRSSDGMWANVAAAAGLDSRVPSRGVATADVDGDGDLDVAVAKQFAPSTFHLNECPNCGSGLNLRVVLEPGSVGDSVRAVPRADAGGILASPAVGAVVSVPDRAPSRSTAGTDTRASAPRKRTSGRAMPMATPRSPCPGGIATAAGRRGRSRSRPAPGRSYSDRRQDDDHSR
nr:VCBS repeat-containing protein [Rathayibacter iranicus]